MSRQKSMNSLWDGTSRTRDQARARPHRCTSQQTQAFTNYFDPEADDNSYLTGHFQGEVFVLGAQPELDRLEPKILGRSGEI